MNMGKTLKLALIMAWYFYLQAPHGALPGVRIAMLVGPFGDEAACRAERNKMADLLQDVDGAKVEKCEFVQES